MEWQGCGVSLMNFQLVLGVILLKYVPIAKHLQIIWTNFDIFLSGLNYKHPVDSRQKSTEREASFVTSSATLQIGIDETQAMPASFAVTYSPGIFACNVCGKVYRWYRNLRSHVRQECGKEPRFLCPYCPHRTKIKSNLKKHIKIRHPLTATQIVIWRYQGKTDRGALTGE